MKQQNKRVYGIGNPLIDIIVSVEDQDIVDLGIHKGTMALIGEERMQELLLFSKTREISFSCGGSCPNTIIALASLGIETTLAGKIGNDENGSIYCEKLKELQVKDELVRTDTQPTGSTVILITPDSERSMNTYLGANRLFDESDVHEETLQQADFFHFTGYMWDTECQQRSIRKALSVAKTNNLKVSFDIADPFAVGRYRETFLTLIKEHCDIVFANREEARILFDNYDPYECCRSMGKLCETAIVKNGKKGSLICHNGVIHAIPVKGPVTPVDTTGAGDVYAAGFLYGQCHQLGIEDSALIASILAGEIIAQRGAQFSPVQAKILSELLSSGSWRSL
ncbi:adenosine kinase [uncultured Sphaerochaeta sp.]|uniref:adenosine kinase n=1 Tax=uncultured Sphaerochaeta sp. TaxID=886478 RepID=UPI002A0A2490|nr:adenosine kinase [uncultured Sphaerochaeta sp.]